MSEHASSQSELLEGVTELVSSTSRKEVFTEAAAMVLTAVEAELVTFAEAESDMLTPIISTADGDMGPRDAIPVTTTIPGCVYQSGNGCVIDDLLDVRGSTAVSSCDSSTNDLRHPGKHRSMVCAPVGEHGILVAYRREPAAFDDHDLAVATAIGDLTEQVASRLTEGYVPENTPNVLEEIARLVSHDVLNEVTLAKGYLSLAREDGEAEHFEIVEDVLENIQSISELVVTLADSGQVIDERVGNELGSTAETAFEHFDTSDVELGINASDTIAADEKCLQRILDNLFRNAIEHSNEAVQIEVGVFDGGFYVADDGPGIPEQARQDAFDPGFTTDANHDGSGLSIVKLLAEAHGWDVTITESAAGGTRVEFRGVDHHVDHYSENSLS